MTTPDVRDILTPDSLCGLLYVGETRQTLRSRMNKHRYDTKDPQYRMLYNHFNQPDHDPALSMKVRFIEKIYHHTNSPVLSTPYRTNRELFWIKELGTAMPYDCSDNIKSVGNLSSPACNDVNVMRLFNNNKRTTRTHGTRTYHRPNVKKSAKCRSQSKIFQDLLSNLQHPLGLHYIRTILFSLPVTFLKKLRDYGLDQGGVNPMSSQYRLSSIICDVTDFRLFKPVRSEELHNSNRKFLHVPFKNKGIDAINLSNILNHKQVTSKIPVYFDNQSVPIVSYSYSNTIAKHIFNYKKALQDLDIQEYSKNPLTCDCSSSPYIYQPSGHVITGNLNIIEHEGLRKIISHGPKFREPQYINWNHNFKIIMDAVEEYARSWIKREPNVDNINTLSEWIKAIRSLVLRRIHKLKNCVHETPRSIFKDREVISCLSSLHDKYVVVPADKASNNIVFVCKKHYYDCLIQELGIDDNSGNPTYKNITMDKDEILANHQSFMASLNIFIDDKSNDLPCLYWTPKLHKSPYKQRYIAGSSKCSTKDLSIILTKILSAVKEGQQKYCDTVYSRSSINHMWILKNSKDLLHNLESRSLSKIHSLKTFDFSTLYTTLPHSKLKSRLIGLIKNSFSYKKGRSFKYIVLAYTSTYFTNKVPKGNTRYYTEEQVINMLEFLIDNIFVQFGGKIFQQTIGIPMGTNCAPLLADLFLYSYETEFLQNLVRNNKIKEARSFNFSYRYIDDVLSLNNSNFADYIPLIYPPELEIKETTDTDHSVSFLDLHLEFDDSGQLSTKIYDKRDDFNFDIVNFPHLSSNIPSSPAYGVYISQLIRYARACSHYQDFFTTTQKSSP